MSLTKHYEHLGISITEGHIGSLLDQQNDILKYVTGEEKSIMEIGFNAGHSAELFLRNTNAYIYSFDIGDHFHQYLKYGKQFLNEKYPNRHTLIFGDSRESLPRFIKNHSELKMDIIFIDGGHDYEIAKSDLFNAQKLSTPNTIIIMDDITNDNKNIVSYTIGPTRVWNEFKKQGILKELEHKEYGVGRGQSVGYFIE